MYQVIVIKRKGNLIIKDSGGKIINTINIAQERKRWKRRAEAMEREFDKLTSLTRSHRPFPGIRFNATKTW